MTLLELSVQYGEQAVLLQERLHCLERCLASLEPEQDRAQLTDRIRLLYAMQREARELAALTGHYYEKGYARSGKYTL